MCDYPKESPLRHIAHCPLASCWIRRGTWIPYDEGPQDHD